MGMVLDRIGLLIRRGIAWWIDSFLAAAIVMVVRWVVNAAADHPLTGETLELYNAIAAAVVFYVYRVSVSYTHLRAHET